MECWGSKEFVRRSNNNVTLEENKLYGKQKFVKTLAEKSVIKFQPSYYNGPTGCYSFYWPLLVR